MKKKISILGSTGSIGNSVLKIIDKKRNSFEINLLSANKSYTKIYHQINKYRPKFFVIKNKYIFEKLRKKFSKNKKTKIFNNFNFEKIGKSDVTVTAVPGISGLQPTLKMLKFSKKMLIANKESVICGWDLIRREAKKSKTKIVPVDSEHFSLFQLLKTHKLNEIDRIYITASGGPFLNYKYSELKYITPKKAIKHPKWKMGKKISVDSATLMNKMLELIEAQKLFEIPIDRLDILIHPNSLIHAIIILKNGLSKFIHHDTTMIIPIANAIFDENLNIKKFYNTNKKNFFEDLKFQKVDSKIFPVYKLRNRLTEFPGTPIIINASNEILVNYFLSKKIPFKAIFEIILDILNDRNYKKNAIKRPNNLNQINKINAWAKQRTLEKISFYND